MGHRLFYFGVAKDGNGKVVSSATISVFLAGSSTVASIYTTLAGTTAVNSTTSGSATSSTPGYWSFYTDAFDYDAEQLFKISISKAGFTTQTYDNVRGEIVLGTYTISAATAVTTHVIIPKGVLYTKSGSGSIAFNGVTEIGLFQVFISFSAGNVTLPIGTTIKPEWFGAIGDKTTDDISALNQAVASTRAYDSLYLTKQYRIASQLAIDKEINITGPGIIWLDVGTSTDGVVVGNDSTYTKGIKWDFGGIFGAAGSCKNALVLKKVIYSEFDLPVKAGTVASTGRAVWIQWGIINKYNFTISGDISYGYGEAIPTNGIELSDSVGAATVGNANDFNLNLVITNGFGLKVLYSGTSGKDRIRGAYQSMLGDAIYVEGGDGVHILNAYLEQSVAGETNHIVIKDHQYGQIGPGVWSGSNETGHDDVQLLNADNTIIDGLRANRVLIDSDCNSVRINELILAGQSDHGITDNGVHTIYKTPIIHHTGNIAIATPTTIFTPAGAAGIWFVFASLEDAGTNYLANARVMWDGSTTARIVSENGAGLTITLSGNAVQITLIGGDGGNVGWYVINY